MKDSRKTKAQLIEELEILRKKIDSRPKSAPENDRPDMSLLCRIADGMLEPTVIIDWDGNLLHGNVMAAGVIGVATPKDLLGMNIGEFVHPDSMEQAAIDLQLVKNAEADFSAKYKLLIDGRTVHIESHGTKIELGDGSVDLVSFRDVTARKEEEKRNQANELVLKSVLDNSSTVIFIKDIEGKYILINKRYEELFGVSNEEIVGKSDFEVFPKEAAEHFRAKDRMAIEAGGPIEEEETVPQEDGDHTYISVKFPLFGKDGKPFATCGIATDISDRKKMEQELLKAREILEVRVHERTAEIEEVNRQLQGEVTEHKEAQKSLAIFQKFAEASAQGFGMADLEGVTTYLNPAVCKFLGFESPKQGIGTHIGKFHPEEYQKQLAEEVIPAVLKVGEWTGEVPLLNADGDPVPMILSMFLLRDESGEPQRFAAVLTDISNRLETEQALEKSERMFRALTESMQAMVLITSTDNTKIVYANEATVRGTGYSLEELLSPTPPKLMSDESLAEILHYREAYFRGEEVPSTIETRLTTKGGEERVFESSWTLIDSGDEGLLKVTTSFDITARKRAEEALRESESKFRSLAESTTAHITIVQDDKYIYANQAFLDYFEVDLDDLEVIAPEDLMMGAMGPEAVETAMSAWQNAEKKGESRFRFEYKDAEGSWFQTNVAMMKLDEKPSVIVTTFDITDLKRAQDELRENEERYRTIFDTAGTGMISFGEDKIITMANEEWIELSGFSKEETIGKLTWVPFFTKASLAKMKKYHEMRTKDPESVPRAYEAEFVDREGNIHDGIVNIQIIPGTQQRVASFQDMTALKRAQKEMYRADKMAALGQIIAGVAHEINNPNNFIYFNLPILRKYIEAMRPMLEYYLEDNPDLKILNMPYEIFLEDVFKLLENMEHGSKRITGIVSELKTYVRSDEGNETKIGCMNTVIDRVMTLVGKQVRKTVKKFDVEVESDLPQLSMNPGKIEQVLINLVINAGQAADKDDSYVKLTARRGTLKGTPCVEIDVTDNGAGIPQEIHDQIFEPFFTSKGRETGTGLGLSISQRIVEEHGGTIEFKSDMKLGTTFTIRLPARTETN